MLRPYLNLEGTRNMHRAMKMGRLGKFPDKLYFSLRNHGNTLLQ
jgi:hypothetical protein